MYFEGRVNMSVVVLSGCEERKEEWFLVEVLRWGKLGKKYVIVAVVVFFVWIRKLEFY